MGLTGALRRAGASRPHVLTALMPGATTVRLAAEQFLRRHGWPEAISPADADILLIAGTVPPELAGAVAETWRAMPAPRATAEALQPGQLAAALAAAQAELRDLGLQRAVAAAAGSDSEGQGDGLGGHGMPPDRGHAMNGGGHHGHGTSGMDAGATDMGAMDGAAMPAGLPMAGRAEDRDGLRLDQVHVPLGPVLPAWPAGLIVRVAVQGDVVQHAEAEAVGPAAIQAGSFWAYPWLRAAAGEFVTTGEAARRRMAAHLDSLGRFLAIAGWDAAAARAGWLRDEALAGAAAGGLRPAAARFARRIARSGVLRWLTAGLGVLASGDAAAGTGGGMPPCAAGDVTARYLRWCRDLREAADALDDGSPLDAAVLPPPRGAGDNGQAASARLLGLLPALLEGADLAAARLIVASLDPDLDELAGGTVVRVGG